MINIEYSGFLILSGANTKARLSTHATPTSRPAILDFCFACVLRLAFVSRQIILRIPNYVTRKVSNHIISEKRFKKELRFGNKMKGRLRN